MSARMRGKNLMKKYREGTFSFEFENNSYELDYHGSWLLDGPEGYQQWLEESLVWNCYDSNNREVNTQKVLIEAEKQLQLEVSIAIV